MDYIYIDESGELAKKTNYFVIGAIIVDDFKKLDRLIRKVRRDYRKYLADSTEIKGTKVPSFIIKKILSRLNNIDYKAFVIVFDKQYKYKINFKDNYNYLYNILAVELANEISISSSTVVYVDKSKNKKEDIDNFNEMFLNGLNNFKDLPVDVNHVDSVSYKGLQVIDLIVWSVFQSVENNNCEFVDIIDNKIIKKVFED